MTEFYNHLLSAITLHPRKQNWNFFIFVIIGNQTFIPQTRKIVGLLGEKLIFFSPLGFEAKSNFDPKTSKSKPESVTVSERYLNDKNPIHDRETASLFRFSAESFESDFGKVSAQGLGTKYQNKEKLLTAAVFFVLQYISTLC